jgi:lipoprotein-anchoring transpeptidase ErfK/SrfK
MRMSGRSLTRAAATLSGICLLVAGVAHADPLATPAGYAAAIFDEIFREPMAVGHSVEPRKDAAERQAQWRRQVVSYSTDEPAGTVVVDSPNTFLYLVLGDGKAIRYAIGVGREGFSWSGVRHIAQKTEWPDWIPPAAMLGRQPYLPRIMAGGPGNPLGARALYLGNTLYRIHGTNQPATIGGHVSSGCIRMLNDDVIDLFDRVSVGTKIIVLPSDRPTPGIARARSTPIASSVTTKSDQASREEVGGVARSNLRVRS